MSREKSTIDRSSSTNGETAGLEPPRSLARPSFGLSATRLGIRTLAAVSRGLAARALGRIWLTPSRAPLSSEARAVLASGTEVSLQVHGRRVTAYRFGDGPAVLLMHGWGGHAGQLTAFVEPLVAAGRSVIAVDAPSHGRSATSVLGFRQGSFVDFAASAPYVDIDMHPADPAEKLDAIFFSPHKFLGGPGASGVLVFDASLYRLKVPDSPGGGTVAWTNPWGGHRFVDNIEAREDGGTPGFLQTIRAALVWGDLRDSTALAERLGRGPYSEVLNLFFDTVAGAIEDAGGEILSLAGDGFLAVFPTRRRRRDTSTLPNSPNAPC